MEVLARLSWVDLAIIAILALGLFIGFTQGTIRHALNVVAVLIAFVAAAQLKRPISDLLGVWQAFPPQGRELVLFLP